MAMRLCLFALTITAMLVSGCSKTEPVEEGIEVVVINGNTFRLEVAANDKDRSFGLAERTSIAEDGGMLFLFDRPMLLSFHMKDCVMDIDAIFLDARGRITALHKMPMEPLRGSDEAENVYSARLPIYTSGSRAVAAIELRAGWIDKLGLKVQDEIKLDLERLKGLAESTDLAG